MLKFTRSPNGKFERYDIVMVHPIFNREQEMGVLERCAGSSRWYFCPHEHAVLFTQSEMQEITKKLEELNG